MSANGIPERARFQPEASLLNAAVGTFLRPKLSRSILSITYSFLDTAGKFNATTNSLQSRLSVIEGIFGDVLTNFTVAYDLSAYRVLFDQAISDPGPTTILLPTEAEDAIAIEAGRGITILLAPPITSAVGSLFVSRFQPTSKGIITPVNSGRDSGSNAGATSTSTATATGGSTTSGGTTSGGGVGGGGSGTGHIGPRPL